MDIERDIVQFGPIGLSDGCTTEQRLLMDLRDSFVPSCPLRAFRSLFSLKATSLRGCILRRTECSPLNRLTVPATAAVVTLAVACDVSIANGALH
jgi:hypothetical protein